MMEITSLLYKQYQPAAFHLITALLLLQLQTELQESAGADSIIPVQVPGLYSGVQTIITSGILEAISVHLK